VSIPGMMNHRGVKREMQGGGGLLGRKARGTIPGPFKMRIKKTKFGLRQKKKDKLGGIPRNGWERKRREGLKAEKRGNDMKYFHSHGFGEAKKEQGVPNLLRNRIRGAWTWTGFLRSENF